MAAEQGAGAARQGGESGILLGHGSDPGGARAEGSTLDQKLPVNVYETTGGLMVVAPMPGIDAEDISITITSEHLTIQGKMRGPRQEERTYLQHEWHYGPYSRTLPLPFPVRAEQANASFGNGVLTV